MTAIKQQFPLIIDRRVSGLHSRFAPGCFVRCFMVASVLILAACSTPEPTLGDRIKSESNSLKEIGDAWNKGEAMVLKGNKLIGDGQKLVDAGERKVEKGQDVVDDGQSMLSKGKRKKADGQSLVDDGEALKREAEASYLKDGGER